MPIESLLDQRAPARCPECGEEINELRYVADTTSYGWEAGTCALDGSEMEYGDADQNDTDYSGDTNYECPSCGCEIGIEENWPVPEPRVEEEVVPVKEVPVTESEDIDHGYVITRGKVTIVTCPGCGFVRDADAGEHSIVCSRCEQEYLVVDNAKAY